MPEFVFKPTVVRDNWHYYSFNGRTLAVKATNRFGAIKYHFSFNTDSRKIGSFSCGIDFEPEGVVLKSNITSSDAEALQLLLLNINAVANEVSRDIERAEKKRMMHRTLASLRKEAIELEGTIIDLARKVKRAETRLDRSIIKYVREYTYRMGPDFCLEFDTGTEKATGKYGTYTETEAFMFKGAPFVDFLHERLAFIASAAYRLQAQKHAHFRALKTQLDNRVNEARIIEACIEEKS